MTNSSDLNPPVRIENELVKTSSAAKKSSSTSPPLVSPSKEPPPLLDIKITNPIIYFRRWWKRVSANEGIDFRFRIRPFTAIALVFTFAAGSFSLGHFILPESSPIIQYLPQLAPSPTPNPWRDSAFTGVLRYTKTNTTYYLDTSSDAEAITLNVPPTVNMAKLVGKRILAVGKYNPLAHLMVVVDASDLEILPTQVVPVPTLPTSATPSVEFSSHREELLRTLQPSPTP